MVMKKLKGQSHHHILRDASKMNDSEKILPATLELLLLSKRLHAYWIVAQDHTPFAWGSHAKLSRRWIHRWTTHMNV